MGGQIWIGWLPCFLLISYILPRRGTILAASKILWIGIISFAFLVLFLYPTWLPWIGEFLVVADPLQKSDAVVVLAGDEDERLAGGAQLFQRGYADWFILTDMRLDIPGSQGVYSANVKRKSIAQGVPAERILIVPGQVASTFEEVSRLKEFTLSKGFKSLIVVTSPYHTRRANLLLHEVYRTSGVRLIIQPASNYSYLAATWWQNPQDRRNTFLEYLKIFGHYLGCNDYASCAPIPANWLKSLENNITP